MGAVVSSTPSAANIPAVRVTSPNLPSFQPPRNFFLIPFCGPTSRDNGSHLCTNIASNHAMTTLNRRASRWRMHRVVNVLPLCHHRQRPCVLGPAICTCPCASCTYASCIVMHARILIHFHPSVTSSTKHFQPPTAHVQQTAACAGDPVLRSFFPRMSAGKSSVSILSTHLPFPFRCCDCSW